MQELASLSAKTPFLALRHPLARKVLREVRRLSAIVPTAQIPQEHYRARPISTARQPGQFLAPPASKCSEGRYNHAGRPVLYLSSSAQVADAELRKPEEGCLIAALTLTRPQKILNLGTEELPSDILQAVTASALLSAPAENEGWQKPEYTFSRFVADCAINAGFTAIRYPSVALPEGYNLVVLPCDQGWLGLAVVLRIEEFHRKK